MNYIKYFAIEDCADEKHDGPRSLSFTVVQFYQYNHDRHISLPVNWCNIYLQKISMSIQILSWAIACRQLFTPTKVKFDDDDCTRILRFTIEQTTAKRQLYKWHINCRHLIVSLYWRWKKVARVHWLFALRPTRDLCRVSVFSCKTHDSSCTETKRTLESCGLVSPTFPQESSYYI